MLLQQFVFFLTKCLPLNSISTTKTDIVLSCSISALLPICSFLIKQSYLQFKILSSITGLDLLSKYNRYVLIYELLSVHYNYRLRLKVFTTSLITTVFSLTHIFSSANWWEREIWDLFGIYFIGNLDLRRILLDYGFEGFPLRKDFPVSGFIELAYSISTKTCKYTSLELSQRSKLLILNNIVF